MWVHLVIFILTAGTFIIWKTGRLRMEGLTDKKSIQLFILVAICGNLLGLFLTATEGADIIYSRRATYKPVHADADMEDLLDRAINQNYVPVIDDQGYFIGIITRKEIIKYCYKEMKELSYLREKAAQAQEAENDSSEN